MKRLLLALPLVSLTFSSCESGPNAQRGTVTGALVGAGVGAIAGNQSGRAWEGAALGAAVGGLAGNAIGGNVDRRNGYYGGYPAYWGGDGRRYYINQYNRRVYY